MDAAIVTELVFEADDFDWALGELLELFDRAIEAGVYPNELDPVVFYDAWSLLCEQPFPVAQRWHKILTSKLTWPRVAVCGLMSSVAHNKSQCEDRTSAPIFDHGRYPGLHR